MQEWHDYFQSRRTNRPQFTLPSRIVRRGNHDALIHSLQRFELGESGEGTHLKAVAAQLGDPTYQQAISLFIREEQDHSQWLGAILDALGAPRLHWHWSDALFVMLRRRMGLKTEICVLLVAEMIAKRYYAALRGVPYSVSHSRLPPSLSTDLPDNLTPLVGLLPTCLPCRPD